jgi:hypothetical protein
MNMLVRCDWNLNADEIAGRVADEHRFSNNSHRMEMRKKSASTIAAVSLAQ